MKKKLLLLSMVILAIAYMLFAYFTNDRDKKNEPSNLEYLNEIALMVINRQVVPDTYFVFAESESLIESIKKYNNLTVNCRFSGPSAAVKLLKDCYDLELSYYDIATAPPDVRNIVEKVTHYNMYRNALELMEGDGDFAQTFFRAGTGDEWNEGSVDNDWTAFFKDARRGENLYGGSILEEYLVSVDSVIEELKKEGAVVSGKALIDQILGREIIRDTYISFIQDPEIVKSIQEYNRLTAQYILYYTPKAITVMTTQSELQTMEVEYKFNYFERLCEVEMFAEQITKYALYANCSELIYAIPSLAFDGGSGVAMWPRFFQNSPEKEFQEQFEGYLDLVESLIISLK